MHESMSMLTNLSSTQLDFIRKFGRNGFIKWTPEVEILELEQRLDKSRSKVEKLSADLQDAETEIQLHDQGSIL
jgi:hypothetical protein